MGQKKNYKIGGVILILIVGILSLSAGCTGKPPGETRSPEETPSSGGGGGADTGIVFHDVKSQAPEFISYYYSITLTPEQEKVKKDALTPLTAPCCSDFSMYTCCCPCNFSKTVWGLSNYLITEQNYTADQVNAAVSKWVLFTNEDGYAGDACSMGRCNYPFREDGCGGMGDELIV
jgi:hypothetical protein